MTPTLPDVQQLWANAVASLNQAVQASDPAERDSYSRLALAQATLLHAGVAFLAAPPLASLD